MKPLNEEQQTEFNTLIDGAVDKLLLTPNWSELSFEDQADLMGGAKDNATAEFLTLHPELA